MILDCITHDINPLPTPTAPPLSTVHTNSVPDAYAVLWLVAEFWVIEPAERKAVAPSVYTCSV